LLDERRFDLILGGKTVDVCVERNSVAEEREMNWWMLVGLITFDLYVVSLAIVVWTIKTAPLVPEWDRL
jgi:hypothetical protein